jgi:hypothetical protein
MRWRIKGFKKEWGKGFFGVEMKTLFETAIPRAIKPGRVEFPWEKERLSNKRANANKKKPIQIQLILARSDDRARLSITGPDSVTRRLASVTNLCPLIRIFCILRLSRVAKTCDSLLAEAYLSNSIKVFHAVGRGGTKACSNRIVLFTGMSNIRYTRPGKIIDY